MIHVPDIHQIPLKPRPAYQSSVVRGTPQASGRIIAMSSDRRVGYVIWRSTPGSYLMTPDPSVKDVAHVVSGSIILREQGRPDCRLDAGSVIEFPTRPFELQVVDTFLKVSFLYAANGLNLHPEPL